MEDIPASGWARQHMSQYTLENEQLEPEKHHLFEQEESSEPMNKNTWLFRVHIRNFNKPW